MGGAPPAEPRVMEQKTCRLYIPSQSMSRGCGWMDFCVSSEPRSPHGAAWVRDPVPVTWRKSEGARRDPDRSEVTGGAEAANPAGALHHKKKWIENVFLSLQHGVRMGRGAGC